MALTQIPQGMLSSDLQNSTPAFKNRIINGAMVIDQRNAGASVTPTGSAFTLDRWQYVCSNASKITLQQNAGSVTPPVNFKYYIGLTVASSYTPAAGEYFYLRQAIEGYNIADLNWGTPNASPVTLSFWVRASTTGSYNVSFHTGANQKHYHTTYTINSANTWEYKTISILGATDGTWNTNTTSGLEIYFNLGVGSNWSTSTANTWIAGDWVPGLNGSTAFVSQSNGSTFYITGVQLEKGSVATAFDNRDYGRELAMCQRYYEKRSVDGSANICMAIANSGNTTQTIGTLNLLVQKRASPTVTSSSASTFSFGWLGGSTAGNSILGTGGTLTTGTLLLGLPTGASQQSGYYIGSGSFLAFESEL